jgi:hypothetical protein
MRELEGQGQKSMAIANIRAYRHSGAARVVCGQNPESSFSASENWITRRVLRLAFQAIGFADVRFGILPSQSGFRRNDEL